LLILILEEKNEKTLNIDPIVIDAATTNFAIIATSLSALVTPVTFSPATLLVTMDNC